MSHRLRLQLPNAQPLPRTSSSGALSSGALTMRSVPAAGVEDGLGERATTADGSTKLCACPFELIDAQSQGSRAAVAPRHRAKQSTRDRERKGNRRSVFNDGTHDSADKDGPVSHRLRFPSHVAHQLPRSLVSFSGTLSNIARGVPPTDSGDGLDQRATSVGTPDLVTAVPARTSQSGRVLASEAVDAQASPPRSGTRTSFIKV